jgi:hypothetical protein
MRNRKFGDRPYQTSDNFNRVSNGSIGRFNSDLAQTEANTQADTATQA